jgi:hypothetical protein
MEILCACAPQREQFITPSRKDAKKYHPLFPVLPFTRSGNF